MSPLSSSTLAETAGTLTFSAALVRIHSTDHHQRWDTLFFDLRGPAPVAAHDAARRAGEAWELTVEQMTKVAAIVTSYVSVVQLVERLADAPLGRVSARLRPAVVEALDALCALEIRRVCTPIEVHPPREFADFADVSLAAMHVTNLTFAGLSPEDFAARYGEDVILAEVGALGQGHLVALVYPGGATALDALAEQGTAPASVTTFIPGVGSGNPEQWGNAIDHARRMGTATGGVAVAWLGYNAPPNVPTGARTEPAHAGARELEQFQRGVSRRWPRAQRILVGHSYGSLVAGTARGVADDIVLVGSPGSSRQHARDFRARVWSATNHDDPITLITGPDRGAFGPAPSDPAFGATPLPGADGRPGGHSSYWDNPAFYTGLRSIVRP